MIAFVDVLLWSHQCKVNTLFANSYLSSYEQKKRFVSIKITGPEFAEKIVSKEIFLTPSVLSAGSITSPQRSISWQHWHSSALVAKANDWNRST